ncbi:hypothetical protein BU17DRAFT_71701 [Hysterangium stoloniferum]|nr:hypothetical protein BU17DRAFT_71701 [Hysterangium stoloniferum]
MNIKAEGDRYKNNTLLEWIVEELVTFVHIRDVKPRASSSQTIEASTQPKNRFSSPLSTLQSSQDRWRSGIQTTSLDDNHEYSLVLTALVSTHGIPLIFYDQIGSGPSTNLLVKKGDGTI